MQTLRPARPLVALLLAAGMLALGSSPAKAALPSSSPTDTHHCANGKTAKTWTKFGDYGLTRLAADNPCKGQWIEFPFTGQSASDPYGTSVFVAPGQRVNLDGAALAEWALSQWSDEEGGGSHLVAAKDACITNRYYPDSGWTRFDGLLFLSEKDVRDAPKCGQPIPKYSANHHAVMACPSSDDSESFLSWKTEGKKIVKLAVHNYCTESDTWAIAWWKLDNGRTVGFWVAPGEERIDLWKSDFGKLPVKSRDGRVRLTTVPMGAEKDTVRSDPNKRPFYYNGFAHDDTVSCTAGKKTC